MLILSKGTRKQLKKQHEDAKAGLIQQFNVELETILNRNKALDMYWILGKVRFPPELGGHVAKVFLEACAEKPPLVKESFLYEVDNRRGVKTLLWVFHPRERLSLPTLGKTISVASNPKKKSKGRNA